MNALTAEIARKNVVDARELLNFAISLNASRELIMQLSDQLDDAVIAENSLR